MAPRGRAKTAKMAGGKVTTAELDDEQALSALVKRAQGETPTRRERDALRRVEKRREEDLRSEILLAVPRRFWVQSSGRHAKQVNDQSDRYGFPMLRGDSIDLAAFAKRFHDFLAENSRKLRAGDEDAEQERVDRDLNLRLKRARVEEREIEVERKRGAFIPVAELREALVLASGAMRRASDLLVRRFGNDAADTLTRAWDEFEKALVSKAGAE